MRKTHFHIYKGKKVNMPKDPTPKIETVKRNYAENPVPQLERQKEKYAENPRKKIKSVQQNYLKRKQNSDKIESFIKQTWIGPYYICTICHRCFYIHSIRKFDQSCYRNFNDNILFPEPSFDGNLYICSTCHLKVKNNKVPCQAVFNKLGIEPIPKELSELRRLEKVLISQRILFKKIAIMHGKGEFSKIKGTVCNVPVESGNVCKILPRAADSNGLIVVKLKRDLKYRGHVYFEPVRPTAVYTALNYLKLNNKFYEDISVKQGLKSDDLVNLCDNNLPADEENDEMKRIH